MLTGHSGLMARPVLQVPDNEYASPTAVKLTSCDVRAEPGQEGVETAVTSPDEAEPPPAVAFSGWDDHSTPVPVSANLLICGICGSSLAVLHLLPQGFTFEHPCPCSCFATSSTSTCFFSQH